MSTTKTRQRTETVLIKQLRVKNVVPLHPCPEAGERCPVFLLDKYISKLPVEAKEKDLFYVRPLEKIQLSSGGKTQSTS